MENESIGIKIADGTFYPILQGNVPGRKKLILTTVNDSQTCVQIDLYRGKGNRMQDASYIGSLMIEEIEAVEKGEPEIDFFIGLNNKGVLSASAGDEMTGERQSLSVSLEALESPVNYDIPDFDVSGEFEPELGMGQLDYEAPPLHPGPDSGSGDDEDYEAAGSRVSPWLMPLFILLGLIIIVLSVMLIHQLFDSEPVPPLEVRNAYSAPLEPGRAISAEDRVSPVA